MLKYCEILIRQGRGGASKRAGIILAVMALLLSAFVVTAPKTYSAEAGTDNFLKTDSGQDLLDVTKTVNEVVGEVLKALTPTDLFNTGTNLPLNLPLNPLNHVKGFGISGLDTDTTDLDLTRFFSPAGVSNSDLLNILKGAAILSIQIFIVVVQIVWQMVQGIRSALNI